MNDEFLNYLGLIPKDHQIVNEFIEQKKSQKPTRRVVKFLTKIPLSTVWTNENFKSISILFDPSKFDSSFKKSNYVSNDYEKYVNSDKHVEVLVKSYKRRRNVSVDKIGLSRRSRLLKREMKSCEVKVNFLTINDILKNKLSDETKQFINKAYSKPIIHNSNSKESLSSDDDQAILVEKRFREYLNSEQFSMYNEVNTIIRKNKASNDKEISKLDSENYYDIESIIKNSPIKYNRTKNISKSDRQTIPFRLINNSPESNNIELIDLTEC